MQLAGALGDVPLELGLVRAQLRLRVLDAIGHGVERFGQLVDLRASRRAGRARCDRPAARRRVAAVRRRTGRLMLIVSSTETSSSRPSTAAALVRRVCSATSAAMAACCAARTQSRARRLLQLSPGSRR